MTDDPKAPEKPETNPGLAATRCSEPDKHPGHRYGAGTSGDPVRWCAGATEAPRKRASSRTAKKTASAVIPASAVVPESRFDATSALTTEQRARVEALEVATVFLPFDVQNGITLCDLAEFVLTGLHPLGSANQYEIDQALTDPDDGGPGGLTYSASSNLPTGATA